MNLKLPVSERDSMPARLRLIPNVETVRGLPCMAVAEALKQHKLGHKVEELSRAAGFTDTDFALMRKYSAREFITFEMLAANELAKALGGFDEAVFECGATAVRMFFDSIAGRTMKLLAGDDPHRLLGSVPGGYQFLVSFGEHKYEKTGPRSGKFVFKNNYLGPGHNAGTFHAGILEVYGHQSTFQIEQQAPVDWTFAISW